MPHTWGLGLSVLGGGKLLGWPFFAVLTVMEVAVRVGSAVSPSSCLPLMKTNRPRARVGEAGGIGPWR